MERGADCEMPAQSFEVRSECAVALLGPGKACSVEVRLLDTPMALSFPASHVC